MVYLGTCTLKNIYALILVYPKYSSVFLTFSRALINIAFIFLENGYINVK